MQHSPTVEEALPGFLQYMAVERTFSKHTIHKYHDNVRWFLRDVGDMLIADIRLEHFIALKAAIAKRGGKDARIANIIHGVKCLLVYARDVLNLPIMDLKVIRTPRDTRKEVQYLTEEELMQFIRAIRLETSWTQQPRLSAYCFRAIVETLATTAMRISEALSLNRDSINFEKREAIITGKGSQQRAIFFTSTAIDWIQRYLNLRKDSGEALFATASGKRLLIGSVEAIFRRTCRYVEFAKSVTPHMLRHTAATNLLQKGCPIGYIKEVLGHKRLETTCHYYLGVLNKAETKKAFDAYMVYRGNEVGMPEAPAAE